MARNIETPQVNKAHKGIRIFEAMLASLPTPQPSHHRVTPANLVEAALAKSFWPNEKAMQIIPSTAVT